MGKPTGFIDIHRKKHPMRPVAERIRDWREVYLPYPEAGLKEQGARCMDCGIPFCHNGCPLRYGIPAFKLEKRFLDRRLDLLAQEGIVFQTNANIGVDIAVEELKAQFDAIVVAGGSTRPRDLPVPGRELKGIHFAMEYLTRQL